VEKLALNVPCVYRMMMNHKHRDGPVVQWLFITSGGQKSTICLFVLMFRTNIVIIHNWWCMFRWRAVFSNRCRHKFSRCTHLQETNTQWTAWFSVA